MTTTTKTPLARAARNAFSIIRTNTNPAFSGINGLIDHRGGSTTFSGQKVSEAGALRVAAVWIAVTVLADQVAGLKMRLLKADDVQRVVQTPPSLRALWGRPNTDQTRFGIESTLTLSEALWGFSAQFLGWTQGGELDVRWPLDPSGITWSRSERGGLKLCSAQGELVNEPNERPQFAYNPWYVLPGTMEPISPVRMAAELCGLAKAYEETSARMMGRGLNPAAVLMANRMVPDADAKEITTRMEQLYGGSGNAGKIAVIGGEGIKLDKLTMSAADAQMLEQYDQVFNVLLAIWRVPATVAGMVDKPSTWGSGVAEFARGLQVFTMLPITTRREEAYEEYITRHVDPSLQVRYKFDSLLAATPKDRADVETRRLQSGVTSVERVLAYEDEPPFRDDETVYSPLALATDEDRKLQRITVQANAYAALIRAGVTADAAAEATNFDPAELVSTGLRPITLAVEPQEATAGAE